MLGEGDSRSHGANAAESVKLIATLISHLGKGQQRTNLRVLLGLIGFLALVAIGFSVIFRLLMMREGQEL